MVVSTGNGPRTPVRAGGHGPSPSRQPPLPGRDPEAETDVSALVWVLRMPAQLVARIKRAVHTPPGLLAGMLAALIALSVVAGVVGTLMVAQKRTSLHEIATRREPVAAAAHRLFRALADADATTVTSFLHGGQDPAKLYARYRSDIEAAGNALAVASGTLTGEGGNSALVRKIMIRLPVYSGLIERAYANKRHGLPVAAAYLHEAYNLEKNQLLVPASKLFSAERDKLVAEQNAANAFPWWTVVFAVLLLAALLFVQIYLRKRTNRLFNVGLATASVAVLLAVVWGAAALIVSSVHASTAREQGSHPASVLQQVELNAITGRAVETLALVNRNPGVQYEQNYTAFVTAVLGKNGHGGLLGQARELAEGTDLEPNVAGAISDMKKWVHTHERIAALTKAGQFEQAVRMAVSGDRSSAASHFRTVDETLLDAVGEARQVFASQNNAALNSLAGLRYGVLLAAVIAVVGSTIGVSKRLQEYR